MNNNNIQIFKNENFGEVRIITDYNNEPLFCLADICKAVGLTNPSSVKSRLDTSDLQLIDLHALKQNEGIMKGNSMANFVTESGFYDVLLYSDAPQVKPFRKWITSEVLPSIRKHGAYMTDNTIEKALTDPDFLIQLATNLKEEKRKRVEAENKAKLLQEDNFYKTDVIEGLTGEISLADMRQRINQIMRKAGVDNARKNWQLLYSEFDKKYHISVMTRIHNSLYQGTKLDYIEKELGALPALYKLTCKLFASSYEQIINDWAKTARVSRLK